MTDADHRRLPSRSSQPKTVTLSERDLEDARRLFELLSTEDPRSKGNELPRILHERVQGERGKLERRAQRILTLRRRRAEGFGKAMFSEPAWDMLLILYASNSSERLTVNRLIRLSGASKATALRWIDYLVDQRLIARTPHPTDARCVFVVLTEKGKGSLDAYLSDSAELDG